MGDAQVVKGISKCRKVNQSLERSRKGQWERRRDGTVPDLVGFLRAEISQTRGAEVEPALNRAISP